MEIFSEIISLVRPTLTDDLTYTCHGRALLFNFYSQLVQAYPSSYTSAFFEDVLLPLAGTIYFIHVTSQLVPFYIYSVTRTSSVQTTVPVAAGSSKPYAIKQLLSA